MNGQFVSNAKGKVTAVQLPLKDWKEVGRKLEAYNIAASIRAGHKEMQQIESGEIRAKSLEQFLDEL